MSQKDYSQLQAAYNQQLQGIGSYNIQTSKYIFPENQYIYLDEINGGITTGVTSGTFQQQRQIPNPQAQVIPSCKCGHWFTYFNHIPAWSCNNCGWCLIIMDMTPIYDLKALTDHLVGEQAIWVMGKGWVA